MFGSLIGAGMGLIAGQNAKKEARKAEDRQWSRQQQLMGQQWQYNEDSANRAQTRNMAMWDYTNYENQKKHIQNAGLNPALMYGQSGGGGASTSGAQAAATNQPTDQSVTAGTAKQGMALQAANLVSQTMVNQASAEKMKAEAEKIKGVDTNLTKAETAFKERITDLQDTVDKVMNSQELLNGANFYMIQSKERKVWAETRSALVNADVDEATKDQMIESAAINNWNNILKGVETISKTSLNEEQINKLKNDMAVAWAKVGLEEASVRNQADKVINDFKIGERNLDLKEEELLKDWIYEGVNAGKQISGEVLNWMTRGVGRNVTEMSAKLEEMFNGKGEQIGTKSVQQQVNRKVK